MENLSQPIQKFSRFPYAETVVRLSDAIRSAGNTIFATIDQSAAAANVGLSLRPTTLIVFGNPKGGTALMQAFPLVGLELPLKFLVWEDGGRVSVSYAPIAHVVARYGVIGKEQVIAAMEAALGTVSDSIV